VSSLSYRRQDQDVCQYPIYAGVLGSAIALGHVLKKSMDLIVFGYLPWATCIAMATSLVGHSLFRWITTYGGETKIVLKKTHVLKPALERKATGWKNFQVRNATEIGSNRLSPQHDLGGLTCITHNNQIAEQLA
jgi:hypothetical protein